MSKETDEQRSRLEISVRELALMYHAVTEWRRFLESEMVLTPISRQQLREMEDLRTKLFLFFDGYVDDLLPGNEGKIILQDTGAYVRSW